MASIRTPKLEKRLPKFLELEDIQGPGDWALRISQQLGADTYVNPPGGRALFDAELYRDGGVKLVIREFREMTYGTNGNEFHPGLSIIDVLMWNHPEQIQAYLSRSDVGVES